MTTFLKPGGTVKLYREDYTRGEIGSKSTYDTGLYDDRAMRR
ncbi:hypothetical protein SynRS9907_01296 [Synechococcus sp. RS9907]|nr:hypothetical protein SynRS9907_01296 [Synechococcus sp. RS9907]